MAQTPQQRKANLKFAKSEEAKRGKPVEAVKKREAQKSPVGMIAIGLLAFVVCGGVVIELIRLFF